MAPRAAEPISTSRTTGPFVTVPTFHVFYLFGGKLGFVRQSTDSLNFSIVWDRDTGTSSHFFASLVQVSNSELTTAKNLLRSLFRNLATLASSTRSCEITISQSERRRRGFCMSRSVFQVSSPRTFARMKAELLPDIVSAPVRSMCFFAHTFAQCNLCLVPQVGCSLGASWGQSRS